MLDKIFKIISFYDQMRWESESGSNLINFYKEDISSDSKLMTHWFCYVTDRQMPFQRIWDLGGFVFSEMVEHYKSKKSLEILNPDNELSFIKANKDREGFRFLSQSIIADNQRILETYIDNREEQVEFISRFYSSDYFSILFTLHFLMDYHFSLSEFIFDQFKKHQEKEDYLKRILFSLHLITYYEIGQPKKDKIVDFCKNLIDADKRTNEINSILENQEEFESKFLKFKKDHNFTQKRAWCSLRDFIKSPEFRSYFLDEAQEQKVNIEKLLTLDAFQQLELPGDVWNNNSKFRRCILDGTKYENSRKSLNKILREYFDEHIDQLIGSYPEQFDVTFDFVPRMCDANNCEICPIYYLKNPESSNYLKTCINQNDKYCSVTLSHCNYKSNCLGNNCELNRVIGVSI